MEKMKEPQERVELTRNELEIFLGSMENACCCLLPLAVLLPKLIVVAGKAIVRAPEIHLIVLAALCFTSIFATCIFWGCLSLRREPRGWKNTYQGLLCLILATCSPLVLFEKYLQPIEGQAVYWILLFMFPFFLLASYVLMFEDAKPANEKIRNVLMHTSR